MKQINTYFKTIALLALSSVLIFSCKKGEEQIDIPVVRAGLFILNEGGFMSNNASLSYYNYDTKTITNDYFASQNQRGLGDTGNDVKIYGSKMYIVVHGSNTIEIVNAKTVKSIKKLSFVNNGTGRQPRYLAFHKNKAFISSFDGTVAVLDTAHVCDKHSGSPGCKGDTPTPRVNLAHYVRQHPRNPFRRHQLW